MTLDRRRRSLGRRAAGCALAAAVVLLASCQASAPQRARPVHHLAPSSPRHTTSAPPPRRPLGVRPWHARVVSSLALADSSLRASYGSLYAFADRGRGAALVRLDPSTGRVAARRTDVLDDPSAIPAPAFAGGLVWVISERHGAREVRLDGVDPDTLELRRHLVVRTRDPVMVRGTDDLDGGDRVDGSALVVAHGRHIELYRPTVRRTQRVTAPATVHDVSLSPDGSSLYAAVGPQTDSTVVQLDLHGAVRARTPTGSAELGLVATNFGFFGTLSTGMAAELDFFHLGNRTPEPISAGGGGSYPLVGLSDGVAWAGGSDALACVDPSTGTVAARVDLGGDRADISGLSALGGRLYADYDGTNGDPTHALIEMTPPRACGLS